MSVRAYQKDLSQRNEAVKLILDGTDAIQVFRNNTLAPLVAALKAAYANKLPSAGTLAAICPDADVKDMDEVAAEAARFNALLAYIDSQEWIPNLPE
jgi:hypothetical protein